MTLYMSDLYRIEIHYPLDEVSLDILYYLYQPLMGSSALHSYMMLYTEGKRMSRFLQPSPLSRIITYTSISLDEFDKNIKKLEALGLLKTYVKTSNDLTCYVYVLLSPLSVRAFFANPILSSLFKESLSEDDYKKTIQYFKVSIEDKSGYEEITSSFTDVFEVVYQKQRRVLQVKDVKEKVTGDVEVNYDFDSLKKHLIEYQVPLSLIDQKTMNYVGGLALTYSVDPLTLASLIKDACSSKGLDRAYFKTKLKEYCDVHVTSSFKEIYHKQPLVYHSAQGGNDPLTLHMKYLDTITPYDFLKEKQGGSEPVLHDLSIVETLMVQLGLKPAVVNMIIEYVLGNNDNRLSKSYCEAIGSSMARKNVQTAMDAYRELTQSKEEVTENQERKEASLVESELEMDEVEMILAEFRNQK